MIFRSLLNGKVEFDDSEELLGFRFRLLNAAMLTGILFSLVFIAIDLSGVSSLGTSQLFATVIDCAMTTGLFLFLRDHKPRYAVAATLFVITNLLTFFSALIFVANDELRVIWFFVGVVVVPILLGVRAGLITTVLIVACLLITNRHLEQPFSGNAMTTLLISLCVTSLFSAAYTRQAISFFERMRSSMVELEQARDAAQAASQAKSAFLANMSHEIRTPMHAILGITHLMQRDDIRPAQAAQLDNIHIAARHLLGIINDILDLSKIDAGKLRLNEAPVAITEIMNNVAAIMSGRAADKGIELQIDPVDLTGTVHGDQTRLQQALLNYVSNAIKFSDRGRVIVRVIPGPASDNRMPVRFEVHDEGVGIPPEKIPRLFSTFEQVDNSITRKHGGTGLGLAITHRLAELMGGTTGVRSVVGEGSTFWFTALLKTGSPGRPDARESQLDAVERIRHRHAGRHILIVDDDIMNREIAQMLLANCGLHISTACNGEESLNAMEANDYDLILMDMQMPVMDGLEATRRIRTLSNGGHLPIIAMTANVFPDDEAQCRDAGMDDFLIKPFEPGNLYRYVLRGLDSHGTRSLPRG